MAQFQKTTKHRSFTRIIKVGTLTGTLVILLVIISLRLNSLAPSNNQKDAINIESKMASYLENKYLEKFQVTGAKLEGAGLGERGTWIATAHPVNDTQLTFEIDGDGKQTYYDTYVGSIWSKQQTAILQPQATKAFGSTTDTTTSVEVHTSGNLEKIATKESPTLEQAMANYPDDFLYKLVIHTTNMQTSEISDHSTKTFSLLESLRKRNVKNIALEYIIDTTSGSMKCSLEPLTLAKYTNAQQIEDCLMSSKVK
jgi:hypothetical protein